MLVPHDDDQLNTFIHNLTVLRQRHGLSLKAMAEILHTSPYTLRKLEKGEITSNLYADSIFYAREYFHISIRELFNVRL